MLATRTLALLALLCGAPSLGDARQSTSGAQTGFEHAAQDAQRRLEESLDELDRLRQRMAEDTIPLSRSLRELEAELVQTRLAYQQTTRMLDSRTLDLGNLRSEIKLRQDEGTYLSNLLGEYVRNFESRLHIAELQRHAGVLAEAKLASEDTSLSAEEIYQAQSALLAASLERLHDALGGTRFEGSAVDADGLVRRGTFVLVGPVAVFRAEDGSVIGTAEQRLGSLEPTILAFAAPEDRLAAEQLVLTGRGELPLDPTLGNAHKIEATRESLVEHVKKGGPVMYPILAMASAALLVALYKWLRMAFLRRPSRRKVEALLEAVGQGDEARAKELSGALRGPVGRMLAAGVEHLNEPRALIEEVMYEEVLTTRLKLQRMLPFIAICAASAPLLGLLGTVTGIINTFKLITVFGSGDVKTLSGGISEALITTKFGLIVAIPSLLLHAFLSRKARDVVGQMETAAVSFVNQVSRGTIPRNGRASTAGAALVSYAPDPELVREQVNEIVGELLRPLAKGVPEGSRPAAQGTRVG